MLRAFAFAFLALCLTAPAAAQSYYLSETYGLSSSTGDQPYAGVVQGIDGNFYGVGYYGGDTTKNGGYGYGAIYQVTPQGVITDLHNFTADCGVPYAPMVSGPDGRLYGTAQSFGASPTLGCVFAISTTGSFQMLHAFTGEPGDGNAPYGTLTLGSDGYMWGTTSSGGAYGYGTVYRVSLSGGDYQIVHHFFGGTADGAGPGAGVVQGDNGDFYGVTSSGGANSEGVVYQLGGDTVFALVYSFGSYLEGSNPVGTLVEGADGDFYGTMGSGGANQLGAIYKVSLGGDYTLLYSEVQSQGRSPTTSLLLGSDGYYYLTTNQGGQYGFGSVERMDTSGNVLDLVDFATTLGDNPASALIQAADGTYWGTTTGGGTPSPGVVFQLTPVPSESGLVTITAPSSATAGSAFTLSWSVSQAYSTTARQCYAIELDSAGNISPYGGKWTGLQKGTYSATTHLYTGSVKLTPVSDEQFRYVLTCGGTAQGFSAVTITSGNTADTTSLAVTPNPVTVGQTATLTATVAHSGSTKPTGIVTFSVSGTPVGSATVSTSGTATLSASTATLAAGTYPVAASYSGDGNYMGSASSAVNVTLNKAATTVTLAAAPNPVTPPAKCTLTATVKRPSGYAGFATGTVTFYVGTAVIGSANLNGSGVATLSAATNGIAAANYSLTAKYNGDSGDAAATSAPVTVTVQ